MQVIANHDATGARHQQTKGNCLCIAVSKLFIRGLREQQSTPISGQCGQCFGLAFQGLDHFVAQQPAQPRGDLGKFFGRARGNGLPLQKEFNQLQQAGWRGERGPGVFNPPVEPHDGASQFAVVPQAELIAVAVEQIRQGLQP